MKRAITFVTFTIAAMICVAGLRLIDKENRAGWLLLPLGIVMAGLHALYRKADR